MKFLLKCNRDFCSYDWISRESEKKDGVIPKRCPRCQSKNIRVVQRLK